MAKIIGNPIPVAVFLLAVAQYSCAPCGRTDFTYQPGRIYGEFDQAFIGCWKQEAPFFGMTLVVGSDGAIRFSSYSEHDGGVEDKRCFGLANQRWLTIVEPDYSTVTYTVVTIGSQDVLL